MARTKSIGIREQLTSLISTRRLREIARETGAVRRRRKVDIAPFFWTLVLGFGTGRERTFAGLRRMYESATRKRLVPSTFWDRFTPGLARFLKAVVREVLAQTREPQRPLAGALEGFRDLVVTDATVLRLHNLLARAFPGCRTNHTQSAAKLHVVMSALATGPRSVKITSERVHDSKALQVGPWVKDRLLLFDLGYYRFQLFDCIRRNGGFFVSRLKETANPLIVSSNLRHRGQAVDVVGKRLLEVLPLLQREILDVQVEVRFKRRVYRGVVRGATQTFRLVGVRDEDSGEYHLYLTNVPAPRLDATEVALTYRARWTVELLFAELKSGYGLDEIPSRKRAAVESFIYATIITLVASRKLLAKVKQRLYHQAHRIGTMRWARLFVTYARDILQIMVAPRRQTRHLAVAVEATMLHEAVDPHLRRPGLIAQVEYEPIAIGLPA